MNNPFWQQFQGQGQQQGQQQQFGNGFNFGQMPMQQSFNQTTNNGSNPSNNAQQQQQQQQQQIQQQMQLQQQQLAFMAGMGNMGFGGNTFGASFAGAGVGGNMSQLQQQQQQPSAAGSAGAGRSNDISALSSMASFFGGGGGGGGAGMDSNANVNASNNAMMPLTAGPGVGDAGTTSAPAPANIGFPSGTGMFGGAGGNATGMDRSSGTGQNVAATSIMNSFGQGTTGDQGMNNAMNMSMSMFGQVNNGASSGASAMPQSEPQLSVEQQLQQLFQTGSSTSQAGTASTANSNANMPTQMLNTNMFVGGKQQQQNQDQNQNLSQAMTFGGTGTSMTSPQLEPFAQPQPQRKKEKQQQQKPFFPTTTTTTTTTTTSTNTNTPAPSSITGAVSKASVPSSGTNWYAQMQQLLTEQQKLKHQQAEQQAPSPAMPPPAPVPPITEVPKPTSQQGDPREGWLASLKANQGAALDMAQQQTQSLQQQQLSSAPVKNADGINGSMTSPAMQPGSSATNLNMPGNVLPASGPDQTIGSMNTSNAAGVQQGAGSASAVSASVMQAMMAAAAAAHPNLTAANSSSAMPAPWASMMGQQPSLSGNTQANLQSGEIQGLSADQELEKLLKVGKRGGVSEEVAKAIFSTRNMSGHGGYGTSNLVGTAAGATTKSQKKKRVRPPKSTLASEASKATSISIPSTSAPVPTAAKPPELTQHQKHRLLVQKVLQANPSLVLAASPPPIESLSGADHLIASTVPSSFPPDLVFRALSSYATLRTLSTQLKISPFSPQAFLRSLALPVPTKLLGEVHSQLLHLLYELRGLGLYTARGDGIRASNNRGDCDGVRRITAHEHAGENLANLDGWTWPLFYADYCSIMEDEFLDSMNSEDSMVDMRSHCMQSIQGLKKLGFISDSSDFCHGMAMEENAFVPSANPAVSPTPPPDAPVAMHNSEGDAVGAMSGRGARRKARPQASMDESDTSSHSSASSDPESDEESSEDEYTPFWRGGGRGRGRGRSAGRGRAAGSGRGKRGRPAKNQGVVAGGEPVPKRPRGRPLRVDESSGNGRSSSSIGSKVEDVTFIPTKNGTHGPSAIPILGGRDPLKVTSSGRPACQVEGCTKTSQGKKYGYMCVSHFRAIPAEELASMLDAMDAKPVENNVAPIEEIAAANDPAIEPLSDEHPPLPILNPVFALPPDTTMSRAFVVSDEIYDNVERALSRKTSTSTKKEVDGDGDDSSEEGQPFEYQVQFERGRSLGLNLKKDSVLGDIIVMSVEDGGMAAGKGSICPNDTIVRVDEFSVHHWSLQCLADYVKAEGPEYIVMTFQVSEKALRDTVESSLSDIVEKIEVRDDAGTTPSDAVDRADTKGLSLYPSVAEKMAIVQEQGSDAAQNDLAHGPTESAIATVDEVEKSDNIVPVALDLLSHRGPIVKIRQGTSYHLLPIDDKLQILEFLLDELISAGPGILEELERRSIASDSFWQTGSGGRPAGAAYGCPPDDVALGGADNNNVCAICSEEGDLLCCDGCVLSYHKRCLCLTTALPQGKWLCPECDIFDPSLLGPITSGKKESLDWFSLNSLGMELSRNIDKTVRVALSKVEFLILHGFVFARDIMSKDAVSMDQIFFSGEDGNRIEDATDAPSAIRLLKNLKGPRYPLPLTQGHLFKLLHCLGPEICSQWPWSQIPFDCQKIWSSEELLPPSTLQDEDEILQEHKEETLPGVSTPSGESADTSALSRMSDRTRSAEEKRVAANATYTKLLAHQQNYRQYFRQSSLYNPLSYRNQYRYIFAGARSDLGNSHIVPHHHFDREDFYQASVQLYNALSRDFSSDHTFVSVLRKYPSLLDPLQRVKHYMTSLEQTLLRSSLLSSLWGAVKKTYSKEAWRLNVEKCRTVQDVARLLVELVDATNSRAFLLDWEMLPKGKGSDHADSSEQREDVFRMYFSITDDWTADREMTRRKWERSEVSDILSLLRCESDGSSTVMFKQHKQQQEQEEGDTVLRSATARKRKSTAPRAIRDDDDIEESAELSDIALPNTHLSEKDEGASPVPFHAPETHSSTGQADPYPPPKKNLPAYRHFCIATMANLKASGDKRSFGAQNKYCSKLWKEIGPEEKAKYQKIAADDKARYQKEAAERDAAMRSELSAHYAEDNKNSSQESTSQTEEADGADNDQPLASPPRTPSSSRDHRRRSGRVQRQKAVHKEIGSIVGSPAGTHRTALEVKDIGHGKLLAKAEQQSLMHEAKEQKIAKLEQLIQHPFERDPMWPLAGRRLFDPEGSLPRSAARCVGRVGGSRKIPNISYVEQFEVGRPSVSHIWRKKTLECNSIETIALQIQILDSYLDKEVIRSCEHLSRRSNSAKHNAPKVVICSHRDVGTGRVEYFVVQRAKRRGCWLDERDIDLPPLITWLSDRFEAQQVKAREVAELARKEAEAEKAALAAAKRARKRKRARAKAKAKEAAKAATDGAERAGKKSKTEIPDIEGLRRKEPQEGAEKQPPELSFRSKLEIPSRPEESKNTQDIGIPKTVVTANPSPLVKESALKVSGMKASPQLPDETKLRVKKEKKKRRKKELSKRSDASSHQRFSASEARNILNAMPRSEGIENCKKFLKHITSSHRKDTYGLLREASKNGKAMVPEETLNNMRVRRLTEMKNINSELEKLGASTYDQAALTQKLVEAERGATKDFVKGTARRKHGAGVGSTSSSKRKRKSSGMYRDSALPRDVVIKSTPSPYHNAIGANTGQFAPANSYSNAMSPGIGVDTGGSNQTAPAGLGANFGGIGNLYNSGMSPEMSVNTSSSMQTAPPAAGAGIQQQFPTMPGNSCIGGGSQTNAPAVPTPTQEGTQGVSTAQGLAGAPAPLSAIQSQAMPALDLQLGNLQRLLNDQQSQLQGILTTNNSSQPTSISNTSQQTASQLLSQLQQQDQFTNTQYQQLLGGVFGQNNTADNSSSMPPPPPQQQQQQQQQSQSTSNGGGDDTDGFDTDAFMKGWGDIFEPTPMRPK